MMNKVIFIELANTWKNRADMVESFPTEDAEISELNKKIAEIMRALSNDLINSIKLFEALDYTEIPTKAQKTAPGTD
jgi:hypothetical protein